MQLNCVQKFGSGAVKKLPRPQKLYPHGFGGAPHSVGACGAVGGGAVVGSGAVVRGAIVGGAVVGGGAVVRGATVGGAVVGGAVVGGAMVEREVAGGEADAGDSDVFAKARTSVPCVVGPCVVQDNARTTTSTQVRQPDVYERPVPGSPALARAPRSPLVNRAPRRPTLTDVGPRLPTFRLTPGAMRTRRRKRQGIRSLSQCRQTPLREFAGPGGRDHFVEPIAQRAC